MSEGGSSVLCVCAGIDTGVHAWYCEGGKQMKQGFVQDVYQDAAGEWRWRVVAANGRIVADSGEGYENRGDCIEMLDKLFTVADPPTFEGEVMSFSVPALVTVSAPTLEQAMDAVDEMFADRGIDGNATGQGDAHE